LNLVKQAALVAIGLAALASAAMAQTLEEKRDEKLHAAFLKKADWILDYDKALEAAKKSGKPIFSFFTRSYSP
jgi:hypothetical protein